MTRRSYNHIYKIHYEHYHNVLPFTKYADNWNAILPDQTLWHQRDHSRRTGHERSHEAFSPMSMFQFEKGHLLRLNSI